MKYRFYIFLLLAVMCGSLIACDPVVEVYGLRCESLEDPLAIDNVRPHFSWRLKSTEEGTSMSAYQLIVASDEASLNENDADLWNSGKVAASVPFGVEYAGHPLESRDFGYWKVRVWNQDGKVSDWSETASFGIGLLDAGDWEASACFIGAVQDDKDSESAPLLRRRIDYHPSDDGRVLLQVNSLGYHEAFVNGTAVSDAVLTPAVSQFGKRSLIVTYDVTDLMRAGENDLVLWLGKGWYQTHSWQVVPGGPYVRAQLDFVRHGGHDVLAVTDGGWMAAESDRRTFGDWFPHRMGGEIVDSRNALADLSAETLDGLDWRPVTVARIPDHAASPQMCELNAKVSRHHPVSVHRAGDDSFIYDMGRNFVGQTDVVMPVVEDGKKIALYYEDYYLKDYADFRDGEYSDYYVGNGKSEGVFSSKFNYKGYRYLKIKGLEAPLALESITLSPVMTDFEGGADFECSDEDLNAIYNMTHETLASLVLGGYMVDCPQIERLGYGGDGNASTPVLQTLFDVSPLYMNWIQAWADCQRENGDMPHTAPNPYSAGGGPFWCAFMIAASWQTWLNYGDERLMERYYPNMCRWLDYAESKCVDGLLKDWGGTEYRNWYLGDWATPKGINQTDPRSVDLVGNCVLSESYDLMSRIADVLGNEEDSGRFREKHERQNDLIHKTFFNPSDNTYATATQIDMAYPMLVGAVPQSCVRDVVSSMKKRTAETFKGHLATGLVGVPVLSKWAVREHEADFMYQMLKKREYPGYLYMIDNGATLTWEHWDGERSHIHNCYNAIGLWFYQALAGIVPDSSRPGYSHVRIEPQMVKGIDWVKASKDTPYGRISVDWKLDGDKFSMTVCVPAGSTATVVLPDGSSSELKSGKHHLKKRL